jgi:capsular polysaccharide biosynthesis protein
MSENQEYEIDLKEIIDILFRRWWIIVAGIIIFGFIGGIYAITSPKIYQASATIMVSSSNQYNSSPYQDINMGQIQASQALTSTYQHIAVSRNVLETVIQTLGLNMSVKDLQGAIKVSNVAQTELLKISVTSKVPEMAKQIANTLAMTFQTQVSNIMNVSNIKILDQAVLPKSPIKPNKKMILAAAVFLGIVIAVGIIFVLEFFDKRIRSIEFFEEKLGLPVLSTIYEIDSPEEVE